MVRNGEGLVARRLVVMADWCSMAFENDVVMADCCSMAFENGDGRMFADVSMAVENDGGRKVVEVVDWCSMAFENGDGLVVEEGSMAFENDGWLNVGVGWRCVLSTAVESGGW